MESNNEIDEEKGVRGIRLNNGDENNDGTVDRQIELSSSFLLLPLYPKALTDFSYCVLLANYYPD